MTFKEIQELIKLVGKSNLTEFKMKNGDFEVAIRTKKYGKYRDKLISAQPSIIPMPASSVANITPAPVAAAPSAPAPTADAASTDAEDTSQYLEVKSPMVGTFYRSPAPDKPIYVKVGDDIDVGSVVCIVEAMKLFNEIESEVKGKIVKVLVEDASPVEYDQVLFLVDPNA